MLPGSPYRANLRTTHQPRQSVWPLAPAGKPTQQPLIQNIDQLSDLLGVQIIVEQTEKRVGGYELDIFGRARNDAVVIGLSWELSDNRVASSVFVDRPCDMDKISEATPEREALFSWIAQNLTELRNVAKKYLVEGQAV